MKLEEKKHLSPLAVLKSFFCVKSGHSFCNFQVFLPANAPKQSAIADDRLLFATL